ncbi:hypothetical protein [Agrobacterium sp. T29]|uniref:hypothetical protein n=1 Tax=Agrobacterium sp. T29 TaxID=2580515 RepID=UPI001AEF308E|nr:hypothetical protein [Agrobacterium sp. T29]
MSARGSAPTIIPQLNLQPTAVEELGVTLQIAARQFCPQIAAGAFSDPPLTCNRRTDAPGTLSFINCESGIFQNRQTSDLTSQTLDLISFHLKTDRLAILLLVASCTICRTNSSHREEWA